MPAGNYQRGDQIGTCGNTGIWSSGPHLHFESNRPELLGSLVQDEATPLPQLPSIRNIGGTPDAIKPQPLQAQR
jgi:murein DD-endopeptidase MepM/ murein hydrolase activator NlpD